MALNSPVLTSSNVVAAVSGEIALAPLGTALPVGTAATADAAFVGLGYFSDDGVREVFETSESSEYAWQNRQEVLRSVDKASVSYEETLIETKKVTVEAYYGTSVTQTATEGTYTINPGGTSGRKAMYFTKIYSNWKIRLVTCEDAEVFKAGNVEDKDGKSVKYPIKIVCYSKPKVYDQQLATGI